MQYSEQLRDKNPFHCRGVYLLL